VFDADVLLIDDNLAFCESVIDLLEDEKDWKIEFVQDGEKALKLLAQNSYKVVLLDLKMPGMSGLDVLKKLNDNELLQKNYIIVLTGEITIENAVYSLQYGATDFMQKPFLVEHPDTFIRRVEKGFRWQEKRLSNEALESEKKQAIEESQLIVKSIGHDMSGSYYGSLMLRLKTLQKKIIQMNELIDKEIKVDLKRLSEDPVTEKLKTDIDKIESLAHTIEERSYGIMELMYFFKELGESLKYLGQAISIDRSHDGIIELNGIMKSAIRFLAESNLQENPDVKVIENYCEASLKILAPEESLLRVFLNLIENAFKAMDGKGSLTISTVKEGDCAIVSIEDTGCGIAENRLDSIWRPDYSQWKNTTGTGLGLLICRKTVDNVGGEIRVESEVNVGTKFILKFKIEK